MSHKASVIMNDSNEFKAPETPVVKAKTKRNDMGGVTMLTPSSSSPRNSRHSYNHIKATSSIKRINKRIRDANLGNSSRSADSLCASNNVIAEASSSQTDDEYPSNGDNEEYEDDDEYQPSKAKKTNSSLSATDLGLVINGIGEDTKPPYSYATLIGMSILTSESKKLTLAQIYGWISDNFKYYKKGDVGWQNSIRHNLSLNKAFNKSEKSKDGKGHYWQIEPGMESMFLKTKNTKKSNSGSATRKSNSKKALKKQSRMSTDSSTKSQKNYISAYQELTPSSSMIQADEEDEIPKADLTDPATDTYSSDNENADMQNHNAFPSYDDILPGSFKSFNLQKTPKQQVLRIRPHQLLLDSTSLESGRGQKRLYNESDEEDQRYHSEEDIDDDETSEDDNAQKSVLPTKRQKFSASSKNNIFSAFKNSLGNIPQLEAPSSSWTASARGDNVVFNIESADKQTNGPPFTSSFSSNLNFDLSPIRRTETGPILEPLTPGNANPTTQSTANNTPNRMKTPSSASIMRKIWNSPTYLDDFYTSPSHVKGQNSDGRGFHDESTTSTPNFAARTFGINRSFNVNASATALAAATSNGSPKRTSHLRHNSRSKNTPHHLESSIIGSISTGYNDFFGVDICSVVKRAVESAVEKPESSKKSEKARRK